MASDSMERGEGIGLIIDSHMQILWEGRAEDIVEKSKAFKELRCYLSKFEKWETKTPVVIVYGDRVIRMEKLKGTDKLTFVEGACDCDD